MMLQKERVDSFINPEGNMDWGVRIHGDFKEKVSRIHPLGHDHIWSHPLSNHLYKLVIHD